MSTAAQSRDDNSFTGIKYLVDATGERQYAISIVDGKPNRNIRAFDRDGETTFKPGETIFAFEEGAVMKTGSLGKMSITTKAVQIKVSAEGKPNSLKLMGVEYDMAFDLTPGAPAATKFTLEPASATLLNDMGFDKNFPKELGGTFATNDFDSTIGPGGLVLPPPKSLGLGAPFPPQHENGANFARAAIAAEEAAKPAAAEEPAKPAATSAPEAKPAPLRITEANVVRTIGEEPEGFHGTRFLLDAANSRQYAVRFENGSVKPPLQAYGTNPQDGGFGKSETIYALDDEMEMRVDAKGKALCSTTLYQIVTDENGKPRNLKQVPVDYEMTVKTDGKLTTATLTLTRDSAAQLAEMNFAKGFPASFQQQLEGVKFSAPGVLDNSYARNIAWPPQHDGSAFIARMNAEKQQVAPAAANDDKGVDRSRYTMPDKTTLVDRKPLGDGQTLKLVFNFESHRVTEIVAGTGLTAQKFSKYDPGALKEAADVLKRLGGTPKGYLRQGR